MRERIEAVWPGIVIAMFGLSFFWALFLVVNFKAFAKFLEEIAHSVPYLGWFLAGPLFGLVALLPAIAGPMAASVGGSRLSSVRIFTVNLFIAFVFLVGLSSQFHKDQWFYLDLILAGQIMTVGLTIPGSVPWNWALFVFFAFAWIMDNILWHLFNLLAVLYLLASGILILTKRWKIEDSRRIKGDKINY